MENTYNNTYVSGSGDIKWLDLINKSCSMLHPSAIRPCFQMLYKAETDTLSEGFYWGGWWIQNSYGFSLGAVPLLNPFWQSILTKSYDLFWDRIGDGKRTGVDQGLNEDDFPPCYKLKGPDGALGDCVTFQGAIAYRQGDGDINLYDWFYEATAAGVLLKCEQLLFSRNKEDIMRYLPLLRRSINHISSVFDENGLPLVGPSANLLAPSYGGSFNRETGELGKGYLTGLSVTYGAALAGMIEVLKIAETENIEETEKYRKSLELIRNARKQLLTPEGYYVKSMDPDGTLHGVYGEKKYGYLEGTCNVDAIALGEADPETTKTILDKIESAEGIRPAGVLCTNHPHLDDTYKSYQDKHNGPHSLGWKSGDWVDGGCWGTVEGRAILAYMAGGRFDDAYRAAETYMQWADEYRMDSPLSQWGHNTNNPWQKENNDYTICEYPVSIMVDNFAVVTCLLRGLFGFRAASNGLYITPHIPESIESISLHRQYYYCGKELSIVLSDRFFNAASLNGRPLKVEGNTLFIPADFAETLPAAGNILVIGEEKTESEIVKQQAEDISVLPEDIRDIYAVCRVISARDIKPAERIFISDIADMIWAAAGREMLPFDCHKLRPMTDDKIEKIKALYCDSVRELWKGYLKHYNDVK
ncbi:MAG: hypothetical protein ACYCWE_06485 [Eubacteriales bacterium]